MLDALVHKVGMQVDMKNTPTMENVCEKLILNFILKHNVWTTKFCGGKTSFPNGYNIN